MTATKDEKMTMLEHEAEIYRLERAMWACSKDYDDLVEQKKRDEDEFIQYLKKAKPRRGQDDLVDKFNAKEKHTEGCMEDCIKDYGYFRGESEYLLGEYEAEFGVDKLKQLEAHVRATRARYSIERLKDWNEDG